MRLWKHPWRLVIIVSCLALVVSCGTTNLATVQVGAKAPDFTLEAVRGGSFHLRDLHGSAVLLSFIDVQPDGAPEAVRAQMDLLKAVQEQYGSHGLAVLIVDATQKISGHRPAQADLLEFIEQWELESIPVLRDDRIGSTAAIYSILSAPSTFLIEPDGSVFRRWEGLPPAQELSEAAAELLGAPAGGLPVSGAATGVSAQNCPEETHAEAHFTGVDLARPLSDEIWVVDNGQPWVSGGAFSLQWIVLDRRGLIANSGLDDSSLVLRVSARYLDNPSDHMLVDHALRRLPDIQMLGWHEGGENQHSGAYLLTVPVELTRPGCLHVQARVLRAGDSQTIYRGEVVVAVK